jgi:hypothetical protein
MNELSAVGVGDALDWLHEQGKRRSETVPEFDVEETLRAVRTARTTGQHEPATRTSPGQDDPQPLPSFQHVEGIQELIDRLAAVARKLRDPGRPDS